MFFQFFVLLVGVVVLDLWLLVEIGNRYGLGPTLVFVVGTSLLGVVLVKSQGFSLLSQSRYALRHGRLPRREFFDGVLVLVGAVLLIIPGLITDALGVLLVSPLTRPFVVKLIRGYLTRRYGGLLTNLLGRGRGRN